MAQGAKATLIAYVKLLAGNYIDYPTISALFTQIGDLVIQGAPKSRVLEVMNQLVTEQKKWESLLSLPRQAVLRRQRNENRRILSLINLVYDPPPLGKCTNC
ncbi:MAG: hypothetical protein ABGX20_14415 [Bacillus sp. (in: firmicutes)]